MTYNFDPELQDIAVCLPTTGFEDVVGSRAMIKEMLGPMNAELDFSAIDIVDRQIPGYESAPDVPVRVYTPKNRSANIPGLLYIHGGGFTVGSLDSEHGFAGMICEKVGVVVVSVDYRLAPENPYPAALNDCYAALQWLHKSATELGVDPERIGISGQSAGGGLAAALALFARDKGGPSICFQVLNIPELDDRLETTSMKTFVDTPLFNRPGAIVSWDFYLGDIKRGSADVPIYAAPGRATDLSGLPPAYVMSMEFDPLRDEGILYALKMLESGVPVELHTYTGTFHGSAMIQFAAVSQRMEVDLLGALQRGLKTGSEV